MATAFLYPLIGVGNAIFAGVGLQTGSLAVLAATGAAAVVGTNIAVASAVAALTPKQTIKVEGQRLTDARVTSSAEGEPINELYGTFRLGGNIIWATRLREVVQQSSSGGGKNSPKVEQTTYVYYASIAIGLCRGEVDSIDKIFFDGVEVSLDNLDYTFYTGSSSQTPDPTIENIEGSGNVPAYKNLCYIVINDLDLTNYGNRVPQVSCEVTKGSPSVADIISDLSLKAGLSASDIDVTDVTSLSVDGFVVRSETNYREAIENLCQFFNVYPTKKDGKVFYTRKLSSTVHTITVDDFVVTDEDPYGISVSRKQPEEMTKQVFISFADASKKFSTGTVSSETLPNLDGQTQEISSIVSLSESDARNLANIILLEDSYSRESCTISLTYDYGDIECGDIIQFSLGGNTYSFRVTTIEVGENLTIEAVGSTSSIYTSQTFTSSGSLTDVDTTPTGTTLQFLNIPLLPQETDEDFETKLAAWQEPWFGSVSFYEDDNSGGWLLNNIINFPSIIGTTTTVLNKGPTGRFDNANTITVDLLDSGDTLSSISELAMLNSGNTLALLAPSGEYEIIQFQNATLNLDGTYTLSKLLRGQLGTEYYMGDPTPLGSTLVILDRDRLSEIVMSRESIGVERSFRYGPSGFEVTDDDVNTNVTYTPKSTAFRTYAPVHLKNTYETSGDITLTWVRRNRLNSDSWEQVEIPLDEETESYEVDIYNGASVVRTLTSSTPTVTYTSADQTTDFGSPQTSLTWRVYQMSASYGRGTPGIV